ncbi:hypothetical protein WA158_000861 [Blastocystis sp. Blastoise]
MIDSIFVNIGNAVVNGFNYFLQLLGMYQKKAKLVVCGLDNSGKTSIIHMIMYNQLIQTIPTLRILESTFVYNGIELNTFDLSSREPFKRMVSYLNDCDAIIYVVDVSNPLRFAEAREELDYLFQNDLFLTIPIAICLNKIDRDNTPSPEDVLSQLNIHSINNMYRPLRVFKTSVIKRNTLVPVFTWITDSL